MVKQSRNQDVRIQLFLRHKKTVGAYRIRPDVREHEMMAMNKILLFNVHPRCREGVMVVDYSPKTVGAYRIRPDMSEHVKFP